MSTQVETGKTRNCVESRCPQDRVFFSNFYHISIKYQKINLTLNRIQPTVSRCFFHNISLPPPPPHEELCNRKLRPQRKKLVKIPRDFSLVHGTIPVSGRNCACILLVFLSNPYHMLSDADDKDKQRVKMQVVAGVYFPQVGYLSNLACLLACMQ